MRLMELECLKAQIYGMKLMDKNINQKKLEKAIPHHTFPKKA